MSTWQNRLSDERDQLGERLAKLRDFLRTGTTDDASYAEVALLREQEIYMASYLEVLNQRIDILESDPK